MKNMKETAGLFRSRARAIVTALLVAVMLVGALPVMALANTAQNPEHWGELNREPRNRWEFSQAFPWYLGQIFWPGFIPGHSTTFMPYMGVDFTEAAINARIQAMRVNFPTGSAWGPRANIGGYCDLFAGMMQEAAFGWWTQLPMLPFRNHDNWDELRVGDDIRLWNSTGRARHAVFVIAISADRSVVTVAEGNVSGLVRWDRDIPMATLSRGGQGANVGISIRSRFAADGTIVGRPDAIQDPIYLPEIDEFANWTPPPVVRDANVAAAPPANNDAVALPPALRPPAVNTGIITVMNESTEFQRVIQVNLGQGWTEQRGNFNGFSNTFFQGVRTITERNSPDVTVEYGGQTWVLRPGDALEIQRGEGTATLTSAAFDVTTPAATPPPAPAQTPAPTPTPTPATATTGETTTITNTGTWHAVRGGNILVEFTYTRTRDRINDRRTGGSGATTTHSVGVYVPFRARNEGSVLIITVIATGETFRLDTGESVTLTN